MTTSVSKVSLVDLPTVTLDLVLDKLDISDKLIVICVSKLFRERVAKLLDREANKIYAGSENLIKAVGGIRRFLKMPFICSFPELSDTGDRREALMQCHKVITQVTAKMQFKSMFLGRAIFGTTNAIITRILENNGTEGRQNAVLVFTPSRTFRYTSHAIGDATTDKAKENYLTRLLQKEHCGLLDPATLIEKNEHTQVVCSCCAHLCA